MNRIEDEFKNRFSNQELSNDGFDSDGLWKDIASDLDKDVPPSFKWPKVIGLIFVFVLGFLAFGFYHKYSRIEEISQKQDSIGMDNQIPKSTSVVGDSTTSYKIGQEIRSENDSQIESANMIVASRKADNNNERLKSEGLNKSKTAKSSDTNRNEKKKSVDAANAENNTSPSILEKSTTKNKLSNTLSIAISDNNQSDASDISPKAAANTENIDPDAEYLSPKSVADQNQTKKEASIGNNDNIDQGTSSSMENNHTNTSTAKPSIANNRSNKTTTASTQNSVNQPFMLPSQRYLVAYEHYVDIDDPKVPYPTPENEEAKNSSWEISIWGGMNSTNLNFRSDLLPALASVKNNAEKKQLGMSFGLDLSKVWNNKYMINSGLEYHHAWSKFDYIKIDSANVLKENQLVKIWVNTSTGDTINRLYDDVNVNSVTTLKIIHHNKYQRFTIPIQFGLQKSTQTIVYGLSAGATFNVTISQSGRTLDSNANIVAFDNDSPASTFKPFGIGLRISPFIGYRISEKLTLNIQPQWNWASRTSFDGSDIKVRAHQLNLNLGIGYRLE